MRNEERIAKLEAEIAALKKAAEPPKAFTPEPYQRYDPTAGMSMPRSTMQEMVALLPDGMIQGIVHHNRAPTGRPGVIPQQQTGVQPARAANPPGDGTGWAREIPLSNPPGVAQADRIADEFARRDRAELAERLGKK